MSRIDVGNDMRSPQTATATPENFYSYADDPRIGDICAQLADALEQKLRGELTDDEHKAKKRELKIGAHFYTPHAHFEKHYKSSEGGPVPSGKAIIDLDGCLNFEQLYNDHLKGREQQLGINMVNISISGGGGHVLFDIPEGLTIQQAQRWMAHQMGDVAYDAAVHELERGIFIPCRQYILYIDEACMFGDELNPAVLTPEETARWQQTDDGDEQPTSTTSNPAPDAPITPSTRAMAAFDETLRITGITAKELNRDGVRHNTLKMLLPTLCQMMPQAELLGVLQRKMPEYSREPDCTTLVANFYTKYVDPNRPLNQKQQEVFMRTLKLTDIDTEPAEPTEQLPQWQINPRQLPLGLRESLKGNPPIMHMPLLVGIMPCLMALASDVEVRYIDGRRHHLGGMSIIKAEQASNKSAIEETIDLWMAPIRKEDEVAREREEQISAKNKNRKNNERGEADPKLLVREVPITISCSRLLKRLKIAQGKTLYSFCPEMDTLVKSNSAGNWSAKYDIYRMAFDRGRWGQDYNSDQAESGVAKVAYNWTILGTPGSVKRCFKAENVENGLSGRMMMSEIPDDPYAKFTVFGEPTADDIRNIEQAVAILRGSNGFFDTPRLRKAMADWVENKRQEAALALDRVKAIFRKRSAVIGFRCGVIYMLLAGKESKSCLEFARTMADYTLYMQIKNFGPILQRQYEHQQYDGQQLHANHVIFNELPSTFVMADLRAMKGSEYSDGALYSIIHRWTKEGWIEKANKTTYKKIKAV